MKNSKSYDTIKKKIIKAFHLERRVFTQKFTKNDKNLIRAQYTVYLVSCMESFFTGIFKEFLDNDLIKPERLSKIKKIKNLKVGSNELISTLKSNDSVSKILVNCMNFQNEDDIRDFCEAIEFNKYSQKVHKTLKKSDKIDKSTKKVMNCLIKQKGNDSLVLSKAMIEMIVEHMDADSILLDLYSADKAFGTMMLMTHMRHKIVHETKEIDIENYIAWGFTLGLMQFIGLINRIYLIKLQE